MMKQLNVTELNIANISYRNPELLGKFVLDFEIDGFPYRLFTKKKENGTIYPDGIVHLGTNNECQYCEDGNLICHELKTHREELFHRLVEHPSIRFDWLYIDHV